MYEAVTERADAGNSAVNHAGRKRVHIERDLVRMAEDKMAKGDFGVALGLFDLAASVGKTSAAIHRGRACCLECLGRFEEALSAYFACLSVAPSSAEAWQSAQDVLASIGKAA